MEQKIETPTRTVTENTVINPNLHINKYTHTRAYTHTHTRMKPFTDACRYTYMYLLLCYIYNLSRTQSIQVSQPTHSCTQTVCR